MTPSQSRILQDVLDRRALIRHARVQVDAYWPRSADPLTKSSEGLLDLLGWLAIETLSAKQLAIFLGIGRVADARPTLVHRATDEKEASFREFGGDTLDFDTLGRDRREILWDGLECASDAFAIMPGFTGRTSPEMWRECLSARRTKIRRFSLLIDELVSRELP